MKMYKHLFWDMDGTLTDSSRGIYRALDVVFAHYGLSPSEEEYRACIGPPLWTSFGRYLSAKEDVDFAVDLFRRHHIPSGDFGDKIFDGLEDVLRTIKRRGYKMYLATSKRIDLALEVLQLTGIEDIFDGVFAANEKEGRIEKEDVLTYAFEITAAPKADSLMIGDTIYDVRGAKFVGIDVLGCFYGFGNRQEMLEAGLTADVEKPTDFLDIFV